MNKYRKWHNRMQHLFFLITLPIWLPLALGVWFFIWPFELYKWLDKKASAIEIDDEIKAHEERYKFLTEEQEKHQTCQGNH